jgi:hypothetical protein
MKEIDQLISMIANYVNGKISTQEFLSFENIFLRSEEQIYNYDSDISNILGHIHWVIALYDPDEKIKAQGQYFKDDNDLRQIANESLERIKKLQENAT